MLHQVNIIYYQANITLLHNQSYKVDPEFYISWTEGAMEFDAMPFPLLIARLSRCYNVDIQIASKELETMKFTGIIFRNKPLDFALDIIHRVSDVKFERKGETIFVKNNNQTLYNRNILN